MASLSQNKKAEIKRDQNWQCDLCGKSIKHGGHIHHKDRNPQNNSRSNLIAICAGCHRKMTARTPNPYKEKPRWI